MNILTKKALMFVFLPVTLTGCLGAGGNAPAESTVMVSEIVSVCGALVGGQAEQRINSEWAKYPELNASRPVIETMAQVLLSDPANPGQQATSEYKKYISCATGLLMTNGLLK